VNSSIPKILFAYTRVSTQKQGVEGVSLEAQQRAIREYAQRHGLTITQWFEERETAAKRGRAIFNQVLTLLRNGKAQGVVMHKIDRSARNLKDWADLGELIDQGIEVHFATENYDLRSRGGRLSADIQAVVAADYVRNLREEVKKGIMGRILQGRYPRAAPIGYLNKGKGVKEPDPVQGPLVRQAFELYATGAWSLDRLIDEMHQRGLRNVRGNKVSPNGVSIMFHNRFYLGLIPVKRTGELFPGAHEPLVAKNLFDRVQWILEGKLADREHRHFFTFSRLLACASCRYHLTGEVQKGHTYYRCHTKICPEKAIREETVEEALFAAFGRIWFPEAVESHFLGCFERFCETMGSRQEEHVRALRLQLDQVSARLSRLADAYTDGILAPEMVREKQNTLITEKKGIEEKLREAETVQSGAIKQRMKAFLELAKSARASYESGFPDEKRSLVKTLTSNLAVQGKRVVVTLEFPFSDFESCPKNTSGSPERGVLLDPQTSARAELGSPERGVLLDPQTSARAELGSPERGVSRTWEVLLERLYAHCVEHPAPLMSEAAI
jgi:DNA invertase Pin-like site-specific DNA recombinase